ncbi:MAG: hypothetical protein ACXWRA_07740 [Pseudobdellovibrionaceae bacterium]
MNKVMSIVFSSVFIAVSHGISCPVINGNFDCVESSGKKYKMEVHTAVDGSVSKYELRTPMSYVTERSDNKVHHNDTANGKTDVNSKGYCVGETFIYESDWSEPDIKPPRNPKVKFKKTMSLDKGNLVQESSYSNRGPIKIVCKKLD